MFGSQIGHLWPNCMAKGDLAQWHESSKILKVISGIPRGCFAWHASWGSAGDALTNTSHASNTQNAFSVWIWRKDVLLSWIHPIEDLSQHVALSYDKYLDVQIQELPTEDLCKTSPPAEKEASQAIVLNSFEPLVVFEQVYRTCLRMTNPQKSDVGCRYPLKLFNIISTMYCILPIQFDRCMLRRCRQKYQRRQRPKTMQVSLWNFVTRPDLVASKSVDDWFEDYRTDFMCLVHRLDIFDPTAWPRAT